MREQTSFVVNGGNRAYHAKIIYFSPDSLLLANAISTKISCAGSYDIINFFASHNCPYVAYIF